MLSSSAMFFFNCPGELYRRLQGSSMDLNTFGRRAGEIRLKRGNINAVLPRPFPSRGRFALCFKIRHLHQLLTEKNRFPGHPVVCLPKPDIPLHLGLVVPCGRNFVKMIE